MRAEWIDLGPFRSGFGREFVLDGERGGRFESGQVLVGTPAIAFLPSDQRPISTIGVDRMTLAEIRMNET